MQFADHPNDRITVKRVEGGYVIMIGYAVSERQVICLTMNDVCQKLREWESGEFVAYPHEVK